MNNSAKVSGAKPADRTKPSEPSLPEWMLNKVRTIVGSFNRVVWKVKHIGLENVPANGGLIIASNHQTYLDPFWLATPIKRPLRFLAWSEALDWPVVGWAMQKLGAWPLQVERSDPSAIRRSLQWLRSGGAVVIFPEGGRGMPDGKMVRFKGGAIRMALEAGVPILPVTIRGGNRIWPAGRTIPRMGRVEIIFHPLHKVKQREGEETRECARRESEELAQIIESAL